jgi:hypothetical protein
VHFRNWTAVKAAIFPFPLAASPMEGLSFVHANVVPVTAPEKLMAVVLVPLHRV